MRKFAGLVGRSTQLLGDMGMLFAATLLLSVSLYSNAKYGDECETFEPSTEEVSRVRSIVGDEEPVDAELSSAYILMKSERFAPTVEWAKRFHERVHVRRAVETGLVVLG